MVAIAHTPQEVLNSLTAADWADLERLVGRLNDHPGDLVDWVYPEEFSEEDWPQEVPLFPRIAEETIEFIYRSLTFREKRRIRLADFKQYSDELVNLLRRPPKELTVAEVVTRVSILADNDLRGSESLAYSFDSGEIVELLERLLEFRQQMAA